MDLPEGYFYPMDVLNYRRMYRALPRGAVTCEIGAYLGRSLCAVADIIQAEAMRVHVVDSWGDLRTGVGSDQVNFRQFIANAGRFGLLAYLVLHVGMSAGCAEDFAAGSLDMLFIDADHSYRAVRQDLDLYVPKVKAGGIIAGHDYNEEPCRRAVEEYFAAAGRRVVPMPDLLWRLD